MSGKELVIGGILEGHSAPKVTKGHTMCLTVVYKYLLIRSQCICTKGRKRSPNEAECEMFVTNDVNTGKCIHAHT